MTYDYYCYILNAKSNLTPFSTEYIYTHSDFKQIEYCYEFLTTFELPLLLLKNIELSFSHNIYGRPRI